MSAAIPTERRYAMQRVAAGDYLLPSNGGRVLWRIRRYTDGPSAGLEIPRDRDFWGVWRWDGEIVPGAALDLDDWSRWDFWEGSHDTRADAVDAALRVAA